MISWNHGLAEVIQSLLDKELDLLTFREFDFSPYDVFPDMVEVSPSRFQNKALGNKIPMVYAIKMRKR